MDACIGLVENVMTSMTHGSVRPIEKRGRNVFREANANNGVTQCLCDRHVGMQLGTASRSDYLGGDVNFYLLLDRRKKDSTGTKSYTTDR